ncbi:MAG: SO_0444 family Cu/Zn efflux transporter [Prevotella sp.]|nr:SO_0444 family Cu/Zn efflux transporter [Prevotella sp.]
MQQRLSTFALEKLNQKQVFNMQEVLNLINEMSPYLLLGFFFAGVMHAFIPSMMYNRYLGGKGFKSVFYGALLGIPLPLCSCGVIPTAMSLRKQGASRGATASFLIATPETGVDSIIATYSILGLPFAIIRPIAALCNAIMGGWLIDNFGDKEEVVSADTSAKHCCCHNEHNHEECTCSCQHDKAQSHHNGILGKMLEALRYGFVEMMGDIGKWLVVGLVIAGLITVFVPEDFFALFRGNTQLSMLLVLCIAIPMYICATGSIPIAVALMMKGLTPGAALVLLMAGPACNMASILVINKTLGRKSLVLYLVSIITMAIIWGHIVDYLLPAEWFQIALTNGCCGIEEGASWLNWSSTIVLGILLLNALWQHYRHPHCH